MWPFTKLEELLEDIVIELQETNKQLERIAMNSAEAAAALVKIEESLEKVSASLTEASTEIPAEIQKLREAIGGDVTPEIEASLGRLAAIGERLEGTSKSLADIVPNA